MADRPYGGKPFDLNPRPTSARWRCVDHRHALGRAEIAKDFIELMMNIGATRERPEKTTIYVPDDDLRSRSICLKWRSTPSRGFAREYNDKELVVDQSLCL